MLGVSAQIVFEAHIHGDNAPRCLWFSKANHRRQFLYFAIKLLAGLSVDRVHVWIGARVIPTRAVNMILYVKLVDEYPARFHEVRLSVTDDFTVKI